MAHPRSGLRPLPPRGAAPAARQSRIGGVCLLALVLAGSAAHAQDRADIDRTQIIGNRELPKVLYIVPWKKPLPGALAGRPLASVLDEALAPLDRDVFARQVNYHGQITTPAKTPTPTPTK
jgi:hypothetical protein